MTSTRRTRRAVVAAVTCALAASGPAVASQPADRLLLTDVAGDANALNDQGEGLIGNVSTSRQVDAADLRKVVLEPLRDRAGRTVGLRLSVTTTAPPASLSDGTPLAYGLVMQPHADCRLVLEYVTAGTPLSGRADHLGRLRHSCDDGRYTEVPLGASLNGRTATVEAPYDLLPTLARAGAEAHSVAVYVRTAPFGEMNRSKPGEIDGTRTNARYVLPG